MLASSAWPSWTNSSCIQVFKSQQWQIKASIIPCTSSPTLLITCVVTHLGLFAYLTLVFRKRCRSHSNINFGTIQATYMKTISTHKQRRKNQRKIQNLFRWPFSRKNQELFIMVPKKAIKWISKVVSSIGCMTLISLATTQSAIMNKRNERIPKVTVILKNSLQNTNPVSTRNSTW